MPSDDERHRDLLPEETAAGSDDPQAEAAAILAESAQRADARSSESESVEGAGARHDAGETVEHRTSDSTVQP